MLFNALPEGKGSVNTWCNTRVAAKILLFFVVAKYLIRKIVVLTMFKLSIHEKIENEREKVYLCRKDNHKKRARASGGYSFSTSHKV